MSTIKKMKNAGIWQALKIIIQVVTQFGYMAVMARLLTKADFGLMALAGSFIGFGILFSEAGMGAALIQRKNITQNHMNAAVQGSILTGIIVFILLYFTSDFIAVFFEQPTLAPIIKVVGVIVILSSLSIVSKSLLQKSFKFKHTSLVAMITIIFGYSLGVITALRGMGVWSLVIANLSSVLLSSLILIYLSPIKFSFKLYIHEWKELFSFGSGLILARLINLFSTHGLNLVLGKIFVPAQLGIFERANTVKTLPSSYLGEILDTIMFPTMAEIQDEEERLFKIYQHGLGVVNTILMPVALFLILFSKEVVLILLGEDWLETVLPLQIMFLVLPFSSSIRMADSVIRAKGLIYKNVYRRAVYVVVLIFTVALGGYFYGLIGAAIGVAFSYIFNYIYMLFLVKSIFQKKITEIFIQPLLSGLRLALIILIPILIYTSVFNAWSHDSIWKFIVLTILMGMTIIILVWKRPTILGEYLQETLVRLFPKFKNKKDENTNYR